MIAAFASLGVFRNMDGLNKKTRIMSDYIWVDYIFFSLKAIQKGAAYDWLRALNRCKSIGVPDNQHPHICF